MKECIFLVWVVATLLLTISLVGLLLFIPDEYNNRASTWMRIGDDLIEAIIRDNK